MSKEYPCQSVQSRGTFMDENTKRLQPGANHLLQEVQIRLWHKTSKKSLQVHSKIALNRWYGTLCLTVMRREKYGGEKQLMEKKSILHWPNQSPDLNPIEQAFQLLE